MASENENKVPEPSMQKVLDEIASFRESAEAKFEEVSRSMKRLEEEMKEIRDEVKEIKKRQSTNTDDIFELKKGVEKVEMSLSAIEDRVEKAERYSRRENLLFHGVEEKKDEDPRKVILELIRTVVPGLQQFCDKDMVRAHRLGKRRPQQNHSRPIIVKFLHHSDMMLVIQKRQDFKTRGIGVSNDLTLVQREEIRQMREQGKRGFYLGGQLYWVPLSSPQQSPTRHDNASPPPSPRGQSRDQSPPRRARSSTPRSSNQRTERGRPHHRTDRQPNHTRQQGPTTRSHGQYKQNNGAKSFSHVASSR